MLNGDNLSKTTNAKTISENQNKKNQYINFAEDDQMEIQGFSFSKLKSRICWVLYVTTLGILRLIFHWYPVLHLKATHRPCDLKIAEKVLLTDEYNGKSKTYFVKRVLSLSSDDLQSDYGNDLKKLLKFRLADGQTKEVYQIRIIKCKKLTYVWDDEKDRFVRIAGLENGISRASFHEFNGQSKDEQARKRIVYGPNEINTPEQTVLTLLVLEALTPFYIFQLFSLILWVAELYCYYAVAIVIMSVVGITTSIVQTRKNQKNLKGTVNFTSLVTISRGDDTYEEISTTQLVPGDVIVVPKFGCEMHCDAVILSGTCIVNESMLTGESVPVTKTPLDNSDTLYNVKEDVNHILFCGTSVIQTRSQEKEKVKAVVIRTGFLTTKGELVRSILYPPPADFKFDQDSYKFIGILGLVAAMGFVYTIVSKMSRQIAAIDITIKALDLITIVIPPALPAAMTIGKLYALQRLKNCKIFCINSRVINVSGSVDCVCFDKTGTLTEDALDMWGVVPVTDSKMDQPIKDIQTITSASDLLRCMTTCHTLTNIDGEVAGDPLDVKMFESTEWIFEDNQHKEKKYDNFTPLILIRPPENKDAHTNDEIGIVKQFQFSSTLQRMSVIIKSEEKQYFEAFCKGSPEKIISLSDKTTVPSDIQARLKEYTRQGYRVIGLATKKLPENLTYQEIAKIQRDHVEADLTFLGLVILENRLKPQTVGVIKTLKDALLKVIMITGDNIQTAVTVARDCEIIDENATIIEVLTEKPTKHEFASISYNVLNEPSKIVSENDNHFKDVESSGERNKNYCFVITGPSWANVVKYFPDLIPKIVTKGAVFARMSGAQKQELVQQLKNLGYYVAMCGDGANDCGALKAAHVGISLSEAESSVASPFTSKEPNISCTPKVIKEGRAALVTSFGVFKMMLCYSLTEFASVIILYGIDTNLSSMQFLFIDVCLILNFAASFGSTKAYDKLAKTPPRTSLLSFVPLCSITVFMFLTVVFQVFAYHFIQIYDWFTPFIYDPATSISITSYTISYENYAVYCVSMFQYVIMAIVFSQGKPYRKNIFTNYIFVFCLVLMTAVCSYITLAPDGVVADILELKMPPSLDGRVFVIWTAALNFVACYIIESLFIEIILEKFIAPKLARFSKSKKQYLDVIKTLKNDAFWPKTDVEVAKMSSFNENEKNGFANGGFISSE